jgi:hypothetical protein
MSDAPISMSFSLNQAVINTAIAAALPGLLKELQFNYTSGRAPKGLTADVTLTEAMIRKAVENYARRTVAATFSHFAIDFQATRGEDGITANITASSAPIGASEVEEAPRASAPVSQEATVIEEDPFEEDEAEADAPVMTTDTTPNAPAVGRSKLFGDLKRPDNSGE